jgi:hypothetical protein
MPFTAETVRRQHQVRLAEKMSEPQKWQFNRFDNSVYCDDNSGYCICGVKTKWILVINHEEDPARELCISSMCIPATTSWLRVNGAETLAEEIDDVSETLKIFNKNTKRFR